jgi:hypothetical protein
MTATNQILSWICRTSKSRLQSLILSFVKEEYYEEISHPGPAEITEQRIEEKSFPTGPVYHDYESDPWESKEEEPEEQQEEQFISCSELVREQPSPENSQPTSASHPPVPTRYIQPSVSSCVAEKAACYKSSRICHSFYEPVNDYMEWHFLHTLEPPYFISTSALGEKLKDVTVLLSRLHHLLPIIDRVKELPFRKLLEWLWWKFTFT